MIYINKNTTNIVILELTSVSSLINPFYLFEFISDSDVSDITYFNSTDLSSFKCRYNRFDIIEAGPTYSNPSLGIINLTSGSYTYNIYESTTLSTNISQTTGYIIDTGKVIVDGIDNNINPVYR